MNTVQDHPFTFHFMQNGNVVGFRSKEGNAGISVLTLDGIEIPYSQIHDTASRNTRLVLMVQDTQTLSEEIRKYLGGNNALTIQVPKGKALDLEKHIDRFASAAQAQKHRSLLRQVKRGEEFRAIPCPHCQATIDLTGYDKTPYIYCRHCQSLLDGNGQLVASGDAYHICDECLMFDQVRGYTIFYFYFLLIVYGARYDRRRLCNSCAAKQAPKVLLLNLPFLLGVPSALYMWIKALTGHDPALAGLSKANSLAKKGLYQESDKAYDQLLMKHPGHPGILLNKARGHLNGKDKVGALTCLGESARSGSNYLPAIRLTRFIQEIRSGRRPA